MKKIFIYTILLLLSLRVNAQHKNIKIGEMGSNEPSIAISYKDPKHIVAAANVGNLYVSHDTGYTWKQIPIGSVYGIAGDPVLTSDYDGNFYFTSLSNPSSGSWLDRVIIQKSNDFGETWTDGVFTGLNPPKDQDKDWVIIDHKKKIMYMTWTEFDTYGSNNTKDSSNIIFSKSTDGGITWSKGVRINQKGGDCIDSDNTTEGAVPAVSPTGDLYVAWADLEGIKFDKSLDQGITWQNQDKLITDLPGGWDFAVPDLGRANGLPNLQCDVSTSIYKGNLYLNWTDQRNGVNNTDVWIMKSTDGGNTWSSKKKINADNTSSHQFFSHMSIDNANGNLYCVYYDRSKYTDNRTDVVLAVSKDGGDTFKNYTISEIPFIAKNSSFFGDYNVVHAYNNIIRPIWTRVDNGVTSVWTAIINVDALKTNISEPLEENITSVKTYPNPFKFDTTLEFILKKASQLTLVIVDNRGKEVASIFKNKKYEAGEHVEKISKDLYNLQSGVYFYLLRNKSIIISKKIILDN
jgi:Secretion system C-terminal sorting domain/BNR/Asp-box repeat